jgi:chlorobactene glucosyltransferase
MMPCGLYILAFCQDLAALQAADSADATATGQFMLIRREAYFRVGGHAAVRGIISEDVALARLMKRNGFRVTLRGASRLLSTRMYTGWRTLWPGLAKNLIDMLGGRTSTVATALAAIVLAWAAVLLPLWDGIGCYQGSSTACVALGPALLASAAAFGMHIAGAIHFGIPAWYGILFPLGYTIGAVMALDSVRQRLTGRVSWKGRTYP